MIFAQTYTRHPRAVRHYWQIPLLMLMLSSAGERNLAAQVIVRYSGTTPYSAAIIAQADYLSAEGFYIVQAARARQMNADAAEKEMKNAVQWVNTYFERRKLNREYRAAENPTHLQKERERYKNRYTAIKYDAHQILDADVTDELNWMLDDLLARSSSTLFISGMPQSLINSPDNESLSKEAIHHIRLSEAKTAGGKTLEFRADTAELLETRWPAALRDAALDKPRDNFDAARDEAIADLKSDQLLKRTSERKLMAALDELAEAFNKAYPQKRRVESPQMYLSYLASKRYLESLALATYRLIDTQNQTAFGDSYRFRGGSVGELLQHTLSKGLHFAKPEPGDEATYRQLFASIRTLYLKAIPDAPRVLD